MKRAEVIELQERIFQMLQKAGIVITPEEKKRIEIADLGLGDIKNCGLQVVVYENNDRYCAKELIQFPRQLCPEHRHPRIDANNKKKNN